MRYEAAIVMFYFDLPVRVLELDELNDFVQHVLNFEVILFLFYLSASKKAQVEHVIHLELDETC